MAQYFNVTFFYTPTITYSKDLETKIIGTFEDDLIFKGLEFASNHIPYIKESHVNEILKYDHHGVKLAKEYAYSKRVS